MLGSLFHPSSYLGVFVFIASTGCGMPIPEEAAIVVAGVLSAQGHLIWWIALVACLTGAIVGDSFMYAIGYHWGHGIFTSHPRFAKLLADENQEQFQKAIESHSLKVMLLARFLIGIRAGLCDDWRNPYAIPPVSDIRFNQRHTRRRHRILVVLFVRRQCA